MMNGYARLLLE